MDSFDDSAVMPNNLKFYLHRLAENSQVSTNVLKINAMNSTIAENSALITVRLPMCLCDMNSWAMSFATSLTNGTSTAGVAQSILPKGIEGIISRLEISCNGLSLLNLQNYGLLYEALKGSHMDLDKSMGRRNLQNECDTSVHLETAGNSVLGSGQVVHVASVANITSSGATQLSFDCICSALYPNISQGSAVGAENAGPVNLTNLGITGVTGFTAAWISAVKAVPAYTQVVSGTTLYGPLVTKFTYNATVTAVTVTGAVSTSTATPTSDPRYSFSLFVNQATPASASTIGGITIPFAASSVQDANLAASTVYYQPNQNNFHTIHDWLSWFKCAPEYINCQMLGEIEIRITLADNSILSYPPDQVLLTRGSYQLNNIYFTIRTMSFDTDIYDNILSEKLASGGVIEIPYPNYFNISQTQSAGNSSTRFSVNTACLEKVIGLNRPSYFNTFAGSMMTVPAGYGVNAYGNVGLVSKGAFFATYQGGGATPFNGGAVSAPNTWNYQINNSFVPNLPVPPETTYFFNQEAWDLHNDYNSSTIHGSPGIYMTSGYQMQIALDLMDSSVQHSLFGIDTRGAVSVCYLLQNNNNANDRTDIFTCFKSILRVAANQQLQVVY